MKIRLGFVSNSSSSSFCLYGVRITEEMKSDWKLPEYMDELDLPLPLENYNPSGYSDYVGVSLTNIKDDETGGQFKERVFELLKGSFPKINKKDLKIYQQAWYNG